MTNPTLTCLYIVVISLMCFAEEKTKVPQIATTHRDNDTTTTTTESSSTTSNSNQTILTNSTNNSNNTVLRSRSFPDIFKNNSAILRAVYVACGFVVVFILYNLIMTRLRRKKNKFQLYGLIKSNSDVEVRPLDQDDEEEETTMFDVTTFKNVKN